jgi:hypothetical protein
MAYYDAEKTIRIGETEYIGFTFAGDDVAGGATLVSGTYYASPSSGLTTSGPTATITDDAKGLYGFVTAATAGEYVVTFTCQFSDGRILIRLYRISVPQPIVTSKALVAIDVLKTQLGIKPEQTDWDDMLDLIVESVSESFSRYVDYPLAKTTLTDVYLDGNGKRDLYLPWKMISALTLEEDGTVLTEGDDADYVLYGDIGMVHRVRSVWGLQEWGGVWPVLPHTLKATSVTAGYVVQDATPATGETALPADLKYACIAQCQVEWKHSQHSDRGVTSRTMPDGTVSKTTAGGFDPTVKDILDRYRRYGI